MHYMTSHWRISQRRACQLIRQPRSSQYCRSRKDPRHDLRQRMREIASTRIRYGYRRVHVLLEREGWSLGRSHAYRMETQEQLQLRSKLTRRRKMVLQPRQRVQPSAAGQAWTMDFVADQLSGGAKFRIFTVVDVFARQALAIEAGSRLIGEHAVKVLNRVVALHRAPKYVFVDNCVFR